MAMGWLMFWIWCLSSGSLANSIVGGYGTRRPYKIGSVPRTPIYWEIQTICLLLSLIELIQLNNEVL